MEQTQSNIKPAKYEHVKERERYKMEVLLKSKQSIAQIAQLLGRHRSTIYRERGKGKIRLIGKELKEKEEYRADVAQRESERRSKERERGLKIGRDRDLEAYIRDRLTKDRHSPDAIIGGIRAQGKKFAGMICTKTLYNYIEQGVFSGIGQQHLWEKGRRCKRNYRPVGRVATKNRMGRSIEERDEAINGRKEYGHWEVDTIKGAQGTQAAFLTLTERRSREECIVKLAQGTQAAVGQAMDDLEKKYGEDFSRKFKSLTMDNGPEFLDVAAIEASCLKPGKKRTRIYFAHPYSSWERGTNENHNRMIRRFIPKGKNLAAYSEQTIAKIETWMNDYPRKILGYLTPNQVAAAHFQGNG